MNEALFKLMARAFDGVASVGRDSAEDGLCVVHVWPTTAGTLPHHSKVSEAHTIADRIEERLGIVVAVKVETGIPLLAIA
jgi:hypothetical protein